MEEGEQRQRLAPQLHLQQRCREHVDEQRVGECAAQIVVGAHLARLVHGGKGGEHTGEGVERLALGGEAPCQRSGKGVEALGVGKGLAADGDEVVARRVEALPRQLHQPQLFEATVERLPGGEAAHGVEAGVEDEGAATEALQTAARLCLPLEHKHTAAGACQKLCAHEAAEA